MRVANDMPLPSSLYGDDNDEFEEHGDSDAFSLASESDIDDAVFMPVGGRDVKQVRCVCSFICFFCLQFFLAALLKASYFLRLKCPARWTKLILKWLGCSQVSI